MSKTILLIDDTPANLGVLFDVLETAGFSVRVSESGEHALAIVPTVRPDIILLDVLMPGLDGLATCRRLKADPAHRDIPVFFITALTEVVDKVAGFAAGAVDYITKPLQPEEVLARVNAHLRIRELQATLEEKNTLLAAQNETLEVRNEQLDAAVQQRLAAERALAQSLDRAVLVVSPAGEIVFRSEVAARLLARHFPADAKAGRLPAALRKGATHPTVTVERSLPADDRGCALLALAEIQPPPSPRVLEPLGLSPREAEILFWVAQGKTSPEIALILDTAVGTVKKHMQHVLIKLHVETRLAAALKATELLAGAGG
jgi:DNA-binding response OmpR family regulator/DNA-binding CsgD family transcriptional regulator